MKTPKIDADVVECKDRQSWLAERTKSVGASESWKLLLGSAMEVYVGKVQPEVLNYSTERQDWGLLLEGPVCDYYRRKWGGEVKPWPQTCLARSRTNPRMHCTPDAILYEPGRDGRGVMQIKTWSEWDIRSWDSGPPLWVQVQVSHEMFVTGSAWGVVAVLFGNRELKRFYIERNERFLEALVHAVDDFWVHVERREPPPVDDSDATTEALKRLHPNDNGQVVLLPADSDDAYKGIVTAQEALKEAKGEVQRLENKLRAAIGDNTFGVTPGGEWVSWKSQTRPAYSVAESTYRVFRTHKKKPRVAPDLEESAKEEADYRGSARRKLSPRLKRKLLAEDNRCRWCGCELTFNTATFEHRVPLSRGGTNERSNITLACAACNQKRGDDATLPAEFFAKEVST